MNRPFTYQDLLTELKESRAVAKDMIVSPSAIRFENGILMVNNEPIQDLLEGTGILSSAFSDFSPTDTFHAQVADKLKIPKRYYDRMLGDDESVNLLDVNVNHWLGQAAKGQKYLLRTFMREGGDNVARAFLSDSYKIIDNIDVLTAAIEAIQRSEFSDRIQIQSCGLTEKRMHVRFFAPSIEKEAPELLEKYRVPGIGSTGKTGIASGFVITNSETGHGRFSISPRVVVAACKNGFVFKEDAFNKTHLGAKLDEGVIKTSDETVKKNLELIVSQVKDAVHTFLSPDYLGQKVDQMREAAGYVPEQASVAIVNTCNNYGIPESKQNDILNFFIEGGDNSVLGISQALTFAAQHEDADTQLEYEEAGTNLLSEYKNVFDVKQK